MLPLSKQIEPLFAGWDETMIWSYLQGFHGDALALPEGRPDSARICVGDFCFFAGTPREQLLDFSSGSSTFYLLIPGSQAWSDLIEKHFDGAGKVFTRYAFCNDASGFDRDRLSRFADSLAQGFHFRQIGEAEYHLTKQEEWAGDLCSQFPDYAAYARSGIGFLIFHGDEPVCGASSYTVYRDGIEIEIDTRKDFRRKGLARACAAKLMLACLDRGLYPSWDAANPISAHLAETLGYRFDHTYPVYEYDRVTNALLSPEE